ncbi:MAG: nucleoside hydrolase [Gammaproteobacteria bacterium]|nr:nucleoside hydrolase [Gammaproteobacteria bacterium]
MRNNTRPVLFDTDIGIDDAMALLFLHYAPEIQLLGITTRFGNASVEDTTRNALNVVEHFKLKVPVFRGAARPLAARLGEGFPAHVHGNNGLGDVDLGEPSLKYETMNAAQAIVDNIALCREQGKRLSIVAVGGLTNIAHALALDGLITEDIEEVIVMGGAFGYNGHRGNVSPVAEANIASDPLAADIVFSSDLTTTIVGLDVTHEVTVDEAFLELLVKQAGEAGQFIRDIMRFYLEFYFGINQRRECPLHDSCAVAYLLQPDLFSTIKNPVRVVTEGIAIGQTIHSDDIRRFVSKEWENIPNSNVCIGVDADAVLKLYQATLARAGSSCS